MLLQRFLCVCVCFFSALFRCNNDIFVIEPNLWSCPRNLIEKAPNKIDLKMRFHMHNGGEISKLANWNCYKQWNIASVYLIKYFYHNWTISFRGNMSQHRSILLLGLMRFFSACVCVCAWNVQDTLTYWFPYLFIFIYLYALNYLRMCFVLNQFAFFHWIAFVYVCLLQLHSSFISFVARLPKKKKKLPNNNNGIRPIVRIHTRALQINLVPYTFVIFVNLLCPANSLWSFRMTENDVT